MHKLHNGMKMRSFICGIILSFLLYLPMHAQVLCDYRLELFDSFGDSWNGAALLVFVNDSSEVYFLTSADGRSKSFPFFIADGDSIRLEFVGGSFDSEIRYVLYDTENNIIFQDGPSPDDGVVFATTAKCPSCTPPPISSIVLDNIRAEFIELSWLATDANGRYGIQIDTVGFNPLNTPYDVITRTPKARVGGLAEKTKYDLYLTSLCASGDTSLAVGPITFETVYKTDVGVVGIVSPVTACGLESLTFVEVTLKNFGANPQTLIPFDFSVNGVPGGVSMPFDGVFTGVLGKDSTFTITFDTRAMVGEPNVYDILAWTAFEGDSDVENDTFAVSIVNIPLVTTYPYFTDFEDWFGGWRIDDTLSRNASWAFGMPNYRDLVRAASGENAWVTGLDTSYNNSELSYLVSPCLDFSSLTEDPVISFSLFFDSEACCDKGWLEMSLDGGKTWETVGTEGGGINWYNDTSNDWWEGNFTAGAWLISSNTLTGAAGASDALLRFVFNSDFATVSTGMGIDNIFISPPLVNNLVALSVNNTSEEECGSARDAVAMSLTNLGTVPQFGFTLTYQVNGGQTVVETFPDTVAVGQTVNYEFDVPFNSTNQNQYNIVAWVSAANEQFRLNDTVSIAFTIINNVPFIEDFESGTLPTGWDTDETVPITNGRDLTSFALSDNLWAQDRFFEVTSPVFGQIESGDSLKLDYRFVNFGGTNGPPKMLASGDSLLIQISKDCGETYQIIRKIDVTNHIPSNDFITLSIALNNYEGENVKLRFISFWGSGDYYLDIDNVNILRCPASLGITFSVVDETRSGAKDGSIGLDVLAGLAPFTYKWSNDATTKGIRNLEAGTYQVTVSDAIGCSETIEIQVGRTVAVQDIDALVSINLAPNPSSGHATLFLTFQQTQEVEVLIFNTIGQLVQSFPKQQMKEGQYELQLNDSPEGLYFVQVAVNGQVHTQRLLLVKD